MTVPKLKYRAEIDGLRAIAVIPVILFHAGFELFGGGFVGVDVFFVISGYLITTIIISEILKERFSLINFYERRARRILPALFSVCVVTLLLSPIILVSEQIFDLGQSLFSVSVFASNYFFYSEIDYFNEFSSKNPLLHTWSLAVEEQFYIIFPLLLILLNHIKQSYKLVISVILIIFLASLLSAENLVSSNRDLAFYSIHTRAWELMAGAIASILLYANYVKPQEFKYKYPIIYEIISIISLALLLASFTLFDEFMMHPGLITFIPVISTFCIILYVNKNSFIGRLLSSKSLVKVGLWSYSLYLIHYPVFSYIDIYYDYVSSYGRVFIKVIALPFIFMFSWLSYKFIETPFRDKSSFSPKSIFLVSLTSIFLLSSIGLIIHYNQGFPRQLNQFHSYLGKSPILDVSLEKEKLEVLRYKYSGLEREAICDPSGKLECKKILTIGDSMAEDVFYSLAEFSPQLSIKHLKMNEICMSSFSNKQLPEQICPSTKLTTKHLFEEAAIATDIIISADWNDYYLGGYYLAKYMSINIDANIFLVGNIKFSDIQNIHLKPKYKDFKDEDLRKFFYRSARKDVLEISNNLSLKIVDLPDVNWIEKSDLFCELRKKECNLINKDNKALIWDKNHLTVHGLNLYNDFLNNQINIQ